LMNMISNAELYVASRGKITRPRDCELWACMRAEFPQKGREELESDIERTTLLLRDLHRVDMIAKGAVDRD